MTNNNGCLLLVGGDIHQLAGGFTAGYYKWIDIAKWQILIMNCWNKSLYTKLSARGGKAAEYK